MSGYFQKNHNRRYALINKPDIFTLLAAHQGWWERNVYGNSHSLIRSFARDETRAAMFSDRAYGGQFFLQLVIHFLMFFSVSIKQRPLRKRNHWNDNESTFLNCDLLTRKCHHHLQRSLRPCMRHWRHNKALGLRNFMNHHQKVPLHLGP